MIGRVHTEEVTQACWRYARLFMRVESEGLAASWRGACMEAAMVVCPAVSEAPMASGSWRQAIWLWPSGRFRRIL
jgi:hypothetical protein